MARLDTAIRQKRFKVRDDFRVVVTIETQMGNRIELQVVDASVTGFGARIPNNGTGEHELQPGQIVPESKIFWNDHSSTLGRLVVKRVVVSDSTLLFGFTCIDAKIPLFGDFSKCFTELSRGHESPLDFELGANKFNLATFVDTEFEHPDLFEKCRQYQYLLGDLKKSALYQYYSVKQDTSGSRATYKFSNNMKKKECVSFASFDYLGFSQEPEVIESAKEAIDRFGMSASGSMVLAGKTSLHEELEAKIAAFFEREDAFLFTTGFAANVGFITSLMRPNDLAVADIFSHASLHDGMAASRAKVRYFKHNSVSNLENILKEHRNSHHGCLVITEGLFSMEGTTPDLRKMVDLAQKYNTRIFVDECHALGVIGQTGRGTAEREGVLDEIDIYMGTFSKGFGAGGGGFITGKKEVIDWLRFFARPGMFSTALPPAVVGASLKVLELVQRLPDRREKLQNNIARFRKGIERLGLKTNADPDSPIVPIIVGDQDLLAKMNKSLIDDGVFVNCILFPAVPIDGSRFRFSITALHSSSDIDLALAALSRALERANDDGETKIILKAAG